MIHNNLIFYNKIKKLSKSQIKKIKFPKRKIHLTPHKP